LLGDNEHPVDPGVDVLVGPGQLAVALVADPLVASAGRWGAQNDLVAHQIQSRLFRVGQPPLAIVVVQDPDITTDQTLRVVLGLHDRANAMHRAAVL
jgi:hypothetical protein